MIRALMLDVDGVIVRSEDGRHWSANLERDLGVSAAALHDHFFAPYWDAVVTGRADLHEQLAEVLRSISSAVSPEQLTAYWFENDAATDARLLADLAALRSSALRVYLASNQEHARVRYLMDEVGLRSYVDGCYYSAALGCRKPDRTFFRTIQARIDLLPSDLLLVDDSAENVAAAIESGWSAEQWMAGKTLRAIVHRHQGSGEPGAG